MCNYNITFSKSVVFHTILSVSTYIPLPHVLYHYVQILDSLHCYDQHVTHTQPVNMARTLWQHQKSNCLLPVDCYWSVSIGVLSVKRK